MVVAETTYAPIVEECDQFQPKSYDKFESTPRRKRFEGTTRDDAYRPHSTTGMPDASKSSQNENISHNRYASRNTYRENHDDVLRSNNMDSDTLAPLVLQLNDSVMQLNKTVGRLETFVGDLSKSLDEIRTELKESRKEAREAKRWTIGLFVTVIIAFIGFGITIWNALRP